ncbi:MAG: hypothetical protein J4F42_17435 [Desulfurellaceae bacterium]|nr:hypothetical protein [Desulfurellaceae bacterium]
MAAKLKPYPAYKDSGVPWLGEVPAHWEVRRGKRTFTPRKELARPNDIQLSATQAYGVIAQADYEKRIGRKIVKILRHLEKRRHVEVDDFVISMRSFQGGLERAWASGCIRSSYIVLQPATNLAVGYFAYLFKSIGYIKALQATANFIRDGQDLNFENFCKVDVPFLPLPEQTAIVRFLDHADRRIQRYIRAKQKLMALLEEQKQALIHQAVTGKLDVRTGQPYPAYKPSGVEWLGDVPAHWDLRPAKWYFREVDERSETGLEELLSVSHVTGVTPRSEKNVTMFKAESNVGHKLCRPGDLVIDTMWARMAALGISRQAGIVSPSYAVYRPHPSSRLLGDYADLLLRMTTYKNEYICRSTGIRSSRLRLYPEEFLRIKLLCPPLEEQHAIIEFTSKESTNARRAIDLAHDELSLLQEYRTRLIADVVTGKLDVREAAERLPDGEAEPKQFDKVKALIDAADAER